MIRHPVFMLLNNALEMRKVQTVQALKKTLYPEDFLISVGSVEKLLCQCFQLCFGTTAKPQI